MVRYASKWAASSTDTAIYAAEFGRNCKSTGANDGTERNWYNGDGLRMRARTFFSSPSRVDDDYVWDQGAGLPVVLQDVRTPSSGSASTTTYLYGVDLISETVGSTTSFYLSDGLGSTTELTDSSGTVGNTYTYDVWGALRSSTGSTSNQFDFTGQQADHNANRGLQYLRARFYDSSLGRFLGQDPLPLLNRYSYVGNNPATLVDPYGLFGFKDIKNGVKSVGGAIRQAAVTVVENPYVQQCVIWGAGGAIAGAGTIAGAVAGAAGGCRAGVISRAWTEHISDDPVSQCAIWGLGAAVGSRGSGLVTGGGCVAGALSWVESKFGDNLPSVQCGTWGAPAFRFIQGDLRARLLAGGAACAAGFVSAVASAEASSLGNNGKE